MVNLVVDIGNTRAKIAIFDKEAIIDFQIIISDYLSTISALFEKYTIEYSTISSVSNYKEFNKIESFLNNHSKYIKFSHKSYPKIQIDYDTPQTLGKDRIAAAIGASIVAPDTNILIVDLGSCITYDFLTKDLVFKGGNIAPGFYMRLKSMNAYTANLPLVEKQIPKELIALSTNDALLFGAYWGIVFEIDSYLSRLQIIYPDSQIILTGGDASFFANSIKKCNFVNCDLVLIGLNQVINYHKNIV